MAYSIPPIPGTSRRYQASSQNEENTKRVTFSPNVTFLNLDQETDTRIPALGDIVPSSKQSTAILSRDVSKGPASRNVSDPSEDISEISLSPEERNIYKIQSKQYCIYTRTSPFLTVPQTAIQYDCLKYSILSIDEDNIIQRIPIKIKNTRAGQAYLSRKHLFKCRWRVRLITQDIGIQPGTQVEIELKKALRRMDCGVPEHIKELLETEPYDIDELSKLFKNTRQNESVCSQFYKFCTRKKDQPIVNELIRMLKRTRLFIFTAFEQNLDEIRFTANFSLAVYSHHKQKFDETDAFKEIDDIYNNIFTSIEKAMIYYEHDALSFPLYTMDDNEVSYHAINQRLNLPGASIFLLVDLMQDCPNKQRQHRYPSPIQKKIKQFDENTYRHFARPTHETASLAGYLESEDSINIDYSACPTLIVHRETSL